MKRTTTTAKDERRRDDQALRIPSHATSHDASVGDFPAAGPRIQRDPQHQRRGSLIGVGV